MTAAGEYRTTRCAAKGHPEFTVVFAREVPVPDLERTLISHFETAVVAGTVFKNGESVQFGWSTLRLFNRPDGTLGVLEPDLRHELKWVESVDQSAMETWRQKEVLASVDLLERIDFPRQAFQAVVCSKALGSSSFVLGRTEPSAPTDSGWFVGCTDEDHDHQAADALNVVPLIEIAVHVPSLTQFFALPQGIDVLVAGPGRMRTKLFLDGNLLTPRDGSYLAALNQAD